MKNSSLKPPQMDKIKDQYIQSMDYLKKTSSAVLADLGIHTTEIHSVKDIPSQLKRFTEKNPNPSIFVKNIDCAFYEVREEMKWKSSMLLALCKQKIQAQEHSMKDSLQNQHQKYKDLILDGVKKLRKSE